MFSKRFWADLAERSFWTFGQAFTGFLVADLTVIGGTGVDWGALLVGALISGGIAVLKAIFLGRNIGDPESASTLPAAAPEP